MSLKNLMEDKKLNLNQPLLSVRRNSTITASSKEVMMRKTDSVPQIPHYKSELKSGPVSEPAVVPFFWERIPGKPKIETKLGDVVNGDDRIMPVPKLPPGRNRVICDNGQGIVKCGSFNSSKAVVLEENYESADEGEVFVDALDTLSRTESAFLNCSMSGLDEPEVKPSTDPQNFEFMISRFLPAAKAMASEMSSDAPQYAHKKQAEVQEQPMQLKKIVMPDRQPQRRYYQQPRDYESETDDDDDDYNHGNVPAKACGLLPSFCFASSFRLLNPVPGMSVRTRAPKPRGVASNFQRKVHDSSGGKADNPRIEAFASPEKVCRSFRELMAAEDSLESQMSEVEDKIIIITEREEKLEDEEAKIVPTVQEAYESNKNTQCQHDCEEKLTSVKSDNENDRALKPENPLALIEFPVPPPLPKSPTDSWLFRTLPSLSTKSSFSLPNLGKGKQRNEAPKWETIVKSSKRQDQHLRSSEELIPFRPIPEAL